MATGVGKARVWTPKDLPRVHCKVSDRGDVKASAATRIKRQILVRAWNGVHNQISRKPKSLNWDADRGSEEVARPHNQGGGISIGYPRKFVGERKVAQLTKGDQGSEGAAQPQNQ
jgi:hypothetical protein